MRGIKALILAAGRGSRMKEFTEEKPKCLVRLGNKPLLEWQLKSIRDAGISKIGLVKGYLGNKIDYNLEYFNNKNWDKTNMVSSLLCATEWIDEELIISYSDIIYNESIIKKLIDTEDNIVISYDKDWLLLWEERFNDPLEDAETFKTDNNGYLTEIGKKASSVSEINGQYMGLIKITQKGWHIILKKLYRMPDKKVSNLDMTALFGILIDNGIKIKTVAVNKGWLELDSDKDRFIYNKSIQKNNEVHGFKFD